MEKRYAVIENKKVINVVINVGENELSENPDKYFEITDNKALPKDIDGNNFIAVTELPLKPYPTDGKKYRFDNDLIEWVEIV